MVTLLVSQKYPHRMSGRTWAAPARRERSPETRTLLLLLLVWSRLHPVATISVAVTRQPLLFVAAMFFLGNMELQNILMLKLLKRVSFGPDVFVPVLIICWIKVPHRGGWC